MGTTNPERRAALLQAPEDAKILPLGSVKVGSNSGSLTVTLPLDTARGLGIERGDQMMVYCDPESKGFVFKPRE